MGFKMQKIVKDGKETYILKGDETIIEVPEFYFSRPTPDFFRRPERTFFEEHPEYKNAVITAVDLSDCVNLTQIGNYAFYNQKNIEYAKMPKSLKEIGLWAFDLCKKMKRFNFEDLTELEEIGSCSFSKSGLETVTLLSKNIKELRNTFENCDNLKYADLSGCTNLTLLSGTFKNSGIENIKLPESLEILSANAFSGCKNLTEFDISHCKNFKLFMLVPIFDGYTLKLLKLPAHFNYDNVYDEIFEDSFYPNVTIMIGDKVARKADGTVNTIQGEEESYSFSDESYSFSDEVLSWDDLGRPVRFIRTMHFKELMRTNFAQKASPRKTKSRESLSETKQQKTK